MSVARRILVVAFDALDGARAHALAEAGSMPALSRLLDNGASGTLATLPPLSGASLAATLATGRRARHHGVAAPVEVRPDGGGIQPAGRRSWRAPAFWEVAAAAGAAVCVVGWPATRPATRWPGVVVDDAYAEAQGPAFDDWPMPPESVAPQTLRGALRGLRVHPTDIAAAEIAALLPAFGTVARRPDERAGAVAALLAQAATVHAAATHLAAAGPDVMVVHYPFLGSAHRLFLAGHGDPGATRGGALDAAYRFQDMLLDRLVAACAFETVVLAAPRGHDDPAAAGFFAMAGPGVAGDVIVHGATVLDVCPTALALLGLAAVGIEGRPLGGLAERTGTARAPAVAGARADAGTAEATHRAPPADSVVAAATAAALMGAAEADIALGAYDEAAGAIERALRLLPGDAPATLLLAQCRVLRGEWEQCAPLADTLDAALPGAPWGSLLRGAALAVGGDAAAAAPHLERALSLGSRDTTARFHLGLLALRLGDPPGAEEHFRAARALRPGFAPAARGLGLAAEARGDLVAAESAFREAIALAPVEPEAHLHLGLALAARGALVEAAGLLRTAATQGAAGAGPALRRVEDALTARAVGAARAAISS